MDFQSLIITWFSCLVRLYPSAYREEFAEQMLLDFSDLVSDARRRGRLSFLIFCLREVTDFPVNLLRIYWQESRMVKVFRSQPVNSGVRGGIGFGIVFAVTNLLGLFIATSLASTDTSLIDRLRTLYIGLFQTDRGFELISWLPMALNALLMGLILGILFALLFGERSKYPGIILVGVLGWFLHDLVIYFLPWCFNMYVFLDGNQVAIFTILTRILSGSFLGLILFATKSDQRSVLRLLVISVFVYPIIAYLSMTLLTHVFVFNTPWRFIALAVLFIIFIIMIFIVTVKIDAGQNRFWLIVAGAVGYPILTFLIGWIARLILPPYPTNGLFMSDPAFWRWQFFDVYTGAIRGILFGLVVGVILGLQNRNRSFKIAR
jgi:hypothetical protein